jgi:DNA-binding NarL/FixJ family response regulator
MMKIVFIDDESVTLKLLRNILDWNSIGFEIAGTALNGIEGLSLCEAVNPDAAIVDIKMPQMDGLEFIHELRKRNEDISLIVLSAYDEFEYAQKAIPYGISAYLLKPLDEIKTVKKAEEERRQAELAARKVEEERKIAAEVVKGAAVSHKAGYIPKPVARSQRIEGKRMTFFVFQGNTFDKEFSGGYIWAPISNKAGTMPHHWTRLLDVRKGDIILHGYDGYVKAISTAKAPCYECVQPNELTVEGLWERDGRRVDCDYIEIRNPVKTSMFKDDIIRLCQVKYSPFDKDGNGNMGYLFEINRELAKIFVEASVINNSYLSEISYISDFLAEE